MSLTLTLESQSDRASTTVSPQIAVNRIDPLRDSRWKHFVDWHPDSSLFHRVEWLQALQSCYGYLPIALTTSDADSPLQNGFVFCEIRSLLTGKRFVSVPFSDHCQPLVSHPDDFQMFASSLTQAVDNNHWKYFEVRPIHFSVDEFPMLGASNTYLFHRLDLSPSTELLYKQFDKNSVQRKIRRAERESLRYEEGSSEKLLKCFYKLMLLTRRRHGLPPQPFKWFQSLTSLFGNDLKIRVSFKNDVPVASILTIVHRKTMVYKYGCSDMRYSNLGGNALVFWHAIQDAKSKGLEELDMGRSDIDNAGLATFKEHWGAVRSTINYWRYPVQEIQAGPEKLVRHVRRLFSIAPDICLKAVSNAFYRHIG